MKILCTGDVHIGRRSSQIPAGSDSHTYSCGDGWLRTAELAVREGVEVVVVTGDLVDEANRFYEAFGVVEQGLKRLRDASIEVILVSGNHDHEVLPRLIDSLDLPGVRLLGRGGRWERATVKRSGRTLHFDGWSFPAGRFPESPLGTYPGPAADGVSFAVLHADLDVPRSPYAPISSAELRRFPQTHFLLGHVHGGSARRDEGGGHVIYPGSPQAMDPAEPGSHGAVVIDLGAEEIAVRTHPLSSVRYQDIDVSLENIPDLPTAEAKIAEEVRRHAREMVEMESELRYLRFRIHLVGATPVHRKLDTVAVDKIRDLVLSVGPAAAGIFQVVVETTAARDLEALREIPGAVGVVSDLVLALEAGTLDARQEKLLRSAVRARQSVTQYSTYLPVLERKPDDEAWVRRELHREATLLLEEMLSQRESAA